MKVFVHPEKDPLVMMDTSRTSCSSDGTPSIQENDVNETGRQYRRSILISRINLHREGAGRGCSPGINRQDLRGAYAR